MLLARHLVVNEGVNDGLFFNLLVVSVFEVATTTVDPLGGLIAEDETMQKHLDEAPPPQHLIKGRNGGIRTQSHVHNRFIDVDTFEATVMHLREDQSFGWLMVGSKKKEDEGEDTNGFACHHEFGG